MIPNTLRVWLTRTIRKHLFRLGPWYTEEDAMQDAELCYHRMLIRYKDRIDPSDTMYLSNMFKRIYYNHINSIAETVHRCAPDTSIEAFDPQPEIASGADMEMVAAEAPEPIKSVLKLLLANPDLVLGRPLRLRLNGKRDRLAKRIKQLLPNVPGIDNDIMQRLRKYLEHGYDPIDDHAQGGIRCRAQDTQPRVEMPEHPRTSLRAGGNGDGAAAQVWKSRGDGGRLRHPQGSHATRGRRSLGSRVPLLAPRPGDAQRPN